MTTNDLPVVAFFKHLLDPFIIWSMLIFTTWIYDEDFTSYYLILVIITFFISSYIYDRTLVYRNWRKGRLLAYVRDTLIGWMMIVGIVIFLGYATKFQDRFSIEVLITWFIITPITLIISHIIGRSIISWLYGKDHLRSAIVIGANETSLEFIRHIEEIPFLLISYHGYFDERDTSRLISSPDDCFGRNLGGLNDVIAYIHKHNIEMVFISLPMSSQPRIQKLMDEIPDTTASVYFLPDIYIFDLMQARFDYFGDAPVVSMNESPFVGIDGIVKNTSDFILSILILILLSPLMLVIAIAVKVTSPGPIIFRQRRYGLNGEEIIVYKFRSMTVAEDGAKVTQATKDDQRFTKIGGFLRRTSLDELPQFINVLQGRMSIVGPRPHAVAHNELYRKLIKGYMLRHKAKPGITGWAQVNGWRGETEVLEKMKARIEHDLYYLQNWSIWLDFWIIIRTVWTVFRKDNAY
ncbi:MAG TPA: undecaprenyl-phosphate glucose phosphotransferase [Nitrosomonas sp.]|nr:undecaprenyl-phosphate glucose phosphotransferase [Nitrosomonas sp.]HQX13096.1 undecaprenyl-phosphate glucose phosphotransferase [Nitrosomonas sp.]HRB32714.1 undecaprenyl-phosphate glucose phosphotransferase [Nitrosomonas sp.]HRB45113.1 undecaprenyl-phosphate glucose phosphotransferase [Nitrosomonas sp.]HRB77346.1 undecaprenyl-phosphate glucose phosphotransferase [Nitrosomonas sp.]